MMYFRYATLVVAYFIVITYTQAQIKNPGVSVAAFAYGQYADIPVSHNTGTGSVTVPLHTITDGPLSLPVSLNYHTAGNIVSVPASSAGLGWNLHVGGMISRTIKGLPDETKDRGYYHHGGKDRSRMGNPYYDMEPDMFTYNIGGQSGKFFIDGNQKVQMVPLSDIKIEISLEPWLLASPGVVGAGYALNRITAILPNGIKYHFKEKDTQGSGTSGWGNIRTIPVGWFLEKITSADLLHTINVEYKTHIYVFKTPDICGGTMLYKNWWGAFKTKTLCETSHGEEIPSYHLVNSRYPTKITTSSGTEEIIFTHQDRKDLRRHFHYPDHRAQMITGLQVKNGNVCFRYDFDQSYFTDDQLGIEESKLKLEGVQKKSCDGSVTEPAWKFEYRGYTASNGKQFAPATNNKNVDHWGYYNYDGGIGPNTGDDLTPRGTRGLVAGEWRTFGSANRQTNEEAMKHGTLQRVTYPTGGNLKLDVEANRYKVDGSKRTALSMSHYNASSTPTSSSRSFPYTTTIHNSINPRWELCVTSTSEFGFNSLSSAKVEVIGASGTVISTVAANGYGGCDQLGGSLPIVGFPYGGNGPMIPGKTYTIKITATSADVDFKIEYENQPTEKLCGGLRLKRTKIHDGISTSRDIIKTYSYNLNDEIGISSGELTKTPTYYFKLHDRTALFTSHSTAPLSDFQGYHISYPRVNIDYNGIGHEELKFGSASSTASSPSTAYPQTPHYFDAYASSLSRKNTFDEQGREVKSVTNYATSSSYRYFGNSSATGYISSIQELDIHKSTGFRKEIFSTPYQIRTGLYQKRKVISTVDGVQTVTDYKYGSANLLPKEVIMQNSNGDVEKTVYRYAADYPTTSIRDSLISNNMIHLPYTTQKYHNGVWVDGSKQDYRFYRETGSSPSTSADSRIPVPRPYRTSKYEKTWNAAGMAH